MGQDEFQVISKYFQRSTEDSAVLLGIGDDAAVVEVAGPIDVSYTHLTLPTISRE